jgi:hypothetical protein
MYFFLFQLDALVDNKEHTSHNSLKDLGYVNKHAGQKEKLLQRIAVFSPDVDPEDIPVPDIMKRRTITQLVKIETNVCYLCDINIKEF